MKSRKQKRGFTPEYYLINDVLMEHNPLMIEGPALSSEYKRYIPGIIKARSEKKTLLKHIEELLLKLNIVDASDESHSEFIQNLCDDIMSLPTSRKD